MKWALWRATVLGILTASTAAAQHARISAGYGRILPSGEYWSRNRAGWQLMGAVEATIPRTPLGLRVDGMHAETRFRSDFAVNTLKVDVVTANLVCHIGAPMALLRLYLLGGVGYVVNISEYGPGFAAGSGVSVGTGPWKAFVEGRFVDAHTSRLPLNSFTVTGGLSFGL
jgi:hypothetical protein